MPSGVLSTDYQPGCLQHLLIHPRRRLLLPEWHPCSQPVLDYMWTLCTVPCNKQPGYDRTILAYKDSLALVHLNNHICVDLYCIISIVDNYKNWKKTVESNPLYVFTTSGPVFLAVDTFLLLGWDWNHMKFKSVVDLTCICKNTFYCVIQIVSSSGFCVSGVCLVPGLCWAPSTELRTNWVPVW